MTSVTRKEESGDPDQTAYCADSPVPDRIRTATGTDEETVAHIHLPFVIVASRECVGPTMNIDDVVAQIRVTEPSTSFMPVMREWIESVVTRFPGMPDDLRHLYAAYGYGAIGKGRYMIHCLAEPSEMFDPETASGLEGVLIVGDDFAGHCEAYDAANGWLFGTIGSDGRFEPYGEMYSSFIDFLEKWFVADEDN